MYEDFFGLRVRPFDLTPSPRFLVLTESHREALRNLEYGIASRKGITLLIGEAGVGKTTVIRSAIETQPVRVHSVHINNPTLTRVEFFETLAERFGLSDRATLSKAVFLAELEALLRDRRSRDETSVLIVDEAQSLSLELLEEIRLLANIETNDEKLMSVIVAGQPELAARLNGQDLRQFKQRVALRCELRALTRVETEAYVSGRIRSAGGIGSQVFTREAVALCYEASKGLPRTINVIADNALLGGFAAGARPVGSDIVLDVCRDFDLHVTLPTPVGATVRPESGAGVVGGRPVKPAPRPAIVRAIDGPVPVPDPGPASHAESGGEMFGAFSARRKRFSFFWN